jgi:serine-type D-Ala-D-Ala carboxypeptidase/endopeptidase (penicillin-binding protein 4)
LKHTTLKHTTLSQGWRYGLTVAIATVAVAASSSPTDAQIQQIQTIPASIPTSIQTTQGRICPKELPAALEAIRTRQGVASARWGVLVASATNPTVLYRHNPEDFLIPASNVKLLTTAAAMRVAVNRNTQELSVLRKLIEESNRFSDNYAANVLLKRIGGLEMVRNSLSPLGISPDSYRQIDGSGLSRNNRAKPSTFVRLLNAMYGRTENQLFYNSLAVGGVSGTLRNRFHNTMAEGRVHAKTGTLTGVRALSGYLENPNYGTMTFSIVVNQRWQSGEVLVKAVDQMVLQMARVTYCDEF